MSSHHVVIKILDLDNDGDNEIVNSTGVWSDELPMSVIQIFLNYGNGNFTDETEDRLFNFLLTTSLGLDLQLIDLNNGGFLIFTYWKAQYLTANIML